MNRRHAARRWAQQNKRAPALRRGVLQFRPGILDEESAKSGPSSLGGSEGRSACFIRQNSTAEPSFSCATAPLKPGPFCALAPRFLAGRRGARRACAPAPFARALCARWGGPFGRAHQRGAQEYLPGPRQIWRTRRLRATRCAHAGRKNKKKPKSIHAARRAKCDFWLYFFVFSLDGPLFPSYNVYHVSSWPCLPLRQKNAENICAF